MNVVICIKAVKGEVVFSNGEYKEPYFFNPYDLKALEECIRLKDTTEFTLTCILMGPKETVAILEKSLAMGADQAIFLSDSKFGGSDTIATTYILSKALENLEQLDIIVCGEKTVDGETGQVVYGLGERLCIPVVGNVSAIESLNNQQWNIVVKKDEKMSRITGSFPVILSIGEFTTVYPKISLLKMKQSKSKPLHIWDASTIEADPEKCGTKGSRTQVKKVRYSFAKRSKDVIKGTTEEKVTFIMKQLDTERKR